MCSIKYSEEQCLICWHWVAFYPSPIHIAIVYRSQQSRNQKSYNPRSPFSGETPFMNLLTERYQADRMGAFPCYDQSTKMKKLG